MPVPRPEKSKPIKTTAAEPSRDSWLRPTGAEGDNVENNIDAETGATISYNKVELDDSDYPVVWKYYFVTGGHISAASRNKQDERYEAEMLGKKEEKQQMRIKMIDSEQDDHPTDDQIKVPHHSMITVGEGKWGEIVRNNYPDDEPAYPTLSEYSELIDNYDSFNDYRNIQDVTDHYDYVADSQLAEFATVMDSASSYATSVASFAAGNVPAAAFSAAMGTYTLFDLWDGSEAFGAVDTTSRQHCWRGANGYGSSGVAHGFNEAAFEVRVPENDERTVEVQHEFPVRGALPTYDYDPSNHISQKFNFEINFQMNSEYDEPGTEEFDQPNINVIDSCSEEVTDNDKFLER